MVLKFGVVKTPTYMTNFAFLKNTIGFKKKNTTTVKVRGETGCIPASVDVKSQSSVVLLV